MNETATLDTARDNANAVSRLIEHCVGRNGSDRNVEDIVKYARLLWFIVRDSWRQFQLRLEHGLGPMQVREAAASASLACYSLSRVIGQLEGLVAPGSEEQLQGLAELLNARLKIEEIQTMTRQIVKLLDIPEPRVDEARLAEGLAAVARGDFEDTSSIIERLTAGGEL